MVLSSYIENETRQKSISYIEALLQFTEEKNIDIDLIAELVKKDPVLFSKIQLEAENLNILKKGARLPI